MDVQTQDGAWIVWLGASSVSFAVGLAWFWRLERPGLYPQKGELTLSWTLRRWLGVRPRTSRRLWAVPLFLLVCAVAVGFVVWLAWHIVAG